MPAKKTMREVLPVLWEELSFSVDGDPERPVNRKVFDKVMIRTETIVSAPVLNRMWDAFCRLYYVKPSPTVDYVVVVDVKAMAMDLHSMGFYNLTGLTSADAHTHHTYTHIHTVPPTGKKVLP